jgi:precorrin-6B methylase 1
VVRLKFTHEIELITLKAVPRISSVNYDLSRISSDLNKMNATNVKCTKCI